MNFTNVSASERKLIKSLSETKHRRQTGLFVAEGSKCVLDTIGAFAPKLLVAEASWLDSHRPDIPAEIIRVATRADMERMTSLSTVSPVVAVYHIPDYQFDPSILRTSLTLALDCIQDPGNLGTLIRLCDWFGIETIIASKDTVSLWNPKTVQSTMGAISRVKVYYVDLPEVLDNYTEGLTVAGTFLGGTPIFNAKLPENGIIVMGNEGHGISPAVGRLCDLRLTIPSYPVGRPTSESLNVAIAASVTISEWRRRSIIKS